MARLKIPRQAKASAASQGRTFSSIEGLGEIKRLFGMLLAEAPIEYEKILRKYGDKIETSAKNKITHEVTGKLKKSIRVKAVFTDAKKRVTVIAGGKLAPHAHLVEFGHRLLDHAGNPIGQGTVPGKHFMRDAFTEILPLLTAEIDEVLADLR